MAKQQKAAYSDMYAQAIADNKQFNAQQVAAARAAATEQKLMQMDALAENRLGSVRGGGESAAGFGCRRRQNAAYSQLQANGGISENRIMVRGPPPRKPSRRRSRRPPAKSWDKRVTSGSNIVPSVIARADCGPPGDAVDILLQRLIAGQAQAANAAEIYSTSRVSNVQMPSLTLRPRGCSPGALITTP